MQNIYEKNAAGKPLWKKALCIFLSVITAFGTFVTITVGSSRLQDWLGIKSMLSAYAAEIVETKGAVAVSEETMLADSNIIELENKDGSNTLYLFSEPISYEDENGNLKTKDISVEKQSDKQLREEGYRYTNGQNDYRINFSEDSSKGIYVQFGECTYSVTAQSDYQVSGKESVSSYLNRNFEVFEYNEIYGTGTSLKFYPQLNGVKDEIILNSNIGKNSFSFKLETENCKAVLNDDGTVSLISNDDESEVQTFTAPFAYDSEYVEGDKDEHYINCAYTLKETAENSYVLTVSVDENWLNSSSTVYPVVIDPTTSNISNYSDSGLYSSASSRTICYGNEATCCFGRTSNSEFGYGRVLNFFYMPSEIKKGAVINSAYLWERETTGRTTTTYVAPCMVSEKWYENRVTWENSPGYYPSTTMARKNINSKSTDKSGDPYWYKFDIVSAVRKWNTGTANNGLLFKSSEEDDGNYYWRAFASRQHSTSAYRPYTVINYTNDTTAPTIKSVTGNPTAWTNGNVTLTVNGAADNSGGAGLHSTAYSFSTTKGSYSWQAANTKTFTSNCTVYIYVRDALGNIALRSTVAINKIDKTKPSAPEVTGNADEWTNADVTLSAGSSDTQSGVAAYSFSTAEGAYAWQTDKTKTFSENTTVYVYAKDNAGNISDASIVEIDRIDKTAPSAPVITGNSENWANGDVELTAQSDDDLSGICAYSFSAEAGKYNWQEENTKTVSDTSKFYVYAKDNAGNISQFSEIDLKIDRVSPSGSVSYIEPSDWVKSVTLTADASDEISGLHETAYSFSSTEGVYNWQSENTKTVSSNGTVYIYVRDTAGNITLLDTVVLDKVDSVSPTVNNVNIDNSGEKAVITIDAADSLSGVSQYSIDNGSTWQSSNIFEIEKDSVGYIQARVCDFAGNTSASHYHDIYAPKLYFDGEKTGIYNPKGEGGDLYYGFLSGPIVRWKKYEKPFYIDPSKTTIYLSYSKGITSSRCNPTAVTREEKNRFDYSESAVDLTLNYNGASFAVKRQYKNDKWSYSFNSSLSFAENGVLATIVTPDFEELIFVQKSRYLYVNETNNIEMSVVYNSDDTQITEYIAKIGGLSYHYSPAGELLRFGNDYQNLFTFTREDDKIEITDGAGRKTAVAVSAGCPVSVTDCSGGVIRYAYSGSNLTKVTDQAGVITGEYEYADGRLVKSGDKTIVLDEQGRVAQYVKDNGYVTSFAYSDNTVTVTSSNGQSSSVTYNAFGNVISSTDENGDETVYTYDDNQNLIKTEQGETVTEYTYDEKGRLETQKSGESQTYYYYDDNDRLIKEVKDEVKICYQYDENGNLAFKGQQVYENGVYAYKGVVRYTYENGMLVKSEDEDNKSTASYVYDNRGNSIKLTNVTENEEGTQSINISENTYDMQDRLITSKSGESETKYTYDAAGRTLLVNADGEYQRTVYDEKGRTVQEIDNSQYNPELDNLPYAYTDKTVGQRYVYDEANNLISETNKFDITTTYEYSEVGTLSKKHFDIYDYYYLPNGKTDKIDVNGNTIVEYVYDAAGFDISVSDGQYLATAKYADGYAETVRFDKNGNVVSKFADGTSYYSSYSNSSKSYGYYESEVNHRTTITQNDTGFTFDQKLNYNPILFSYKTSTENDVTTVTEIHFKGKEYKTVVDNNSVVYITPNSTVNYAVDGDDRLASENISSNDNVVLSSTINYSENNDILEKSYDLNNISYLSQYDNDGNIISDERNAYIYNECGELISTAGEINSQYSYDSRGNMLTKTTDGETTEFSYANSAWQDQLASVNGVNLTYDANGNLSSYGGKEYTWSHGKRLSKVTDGENAYSYKYDSDGIRTSKTINGVTTNYDIIGTTVLAQYDAKNEILFQYNGSTPIGFVLNDVQYLYITNQSGDVRGITDAQGNLIAQYAYDEWGKLLSVDAENEENRAVAEINPLRYRGYYYDNETGLYYLQSRYYNPEWCRFISADGFDYLSTSNHRTSNAYIYCWNNPIVLDDAEGTAPKISIDLEKIWAFVVKGYNKIVSKFEERFEKFAVKVNAFAEKAKYYSDNPGALFKKVITDFETLTNKTLSFILGQEISLKFKMLEWLKENVSFETSPTEEDDSGITLYSSDSESKGDDRNIVNAIFQGIVAALELDCINRILEAFGSSLNKLAKKSFEAFEQGCLILVTTINTAIDYVKKSFFLDLGLSGGGELLKKGEEIASEGEQLINAKGIGKGFDGLVSFFQFAVDINSAGSGIYSKTEDIVMAAVSLVADIASIFIPSFFLGMFVSFLGDAVPQIVLLRKHGYITPVSV